MNKELFNLHLCSLRSKGASDAIFRRKNIDVTYFDLKKYDPFSFLKIAKFVKDKNIDILHLTGYGSMTFGRIAGMLCCRPTIIHELWVDPGLGRLQSLIERFLGLITTRAIAISHYTKEYLINKKGIREEKIVIIRNGVPLEKFNSANDSLGAIMRKEFSIPDECPVIAIIGMLHENKGHKYFINAAKEVISVKENARFVIVGEGELRADLERQVKELELEGKVMFLGQQEDIPAILQMVDIFVLASFS